MKPERSELISALHDAEHIIAEIERSAPIIRSLLQKAAIGCAYPSVGFEAKARRIRAAIKKEADSCDQSGQATLPIPQPANLHPKLQPIGNMPQAGKQPPLVCGGKRGNAGQRNALR